MNKTLFTKWLALCLSMGFLIGIHNGRIGIWQGQDPTPYRIIPCPVFLLTQSQQDALAHGIRIDTMEDVENLIKDFFP